MIEDSDYGNSTLKLLAFQALALYSVPALLPMLNDSDPIVRTEVARALQIRGGEDAFRVASDLAKSARFEGREIAAFLLGQLGTPEPPFRAESIPLIRDLLKDPYHEVRSAAAAALGHLGASESLPELLVLAEDDNADVREQVAFALYCFGPSAASELALKQLGNDSHSGVRSWAELALKTRDDGFA